MTSTLLFPFTFTVSVVLGVGFLALPVELRHTGFTPFLVTFSLNLLVQLAMLVLFFEVLQRAHAGYETRLLQQAAGPIDEFGLASDGLFTGDTEQLGSRLDLHSLGEAYLPPWGSRVFDVVVLTHLVAILISYCIGGSRELANALRVVLDVKVPVPATTAAYFAGLVVVVLALDRLIAVAVTALTLVKGLLLLTVVAVVGYVAGVVREPVESSWSQAMDPLAMGSLALGGAMNAVPVFFKGVPFERAGIRRLTAAACAAVATGWAVMVLWVLCILHIVPQRGPGMDTLEGAARQSVLSTIPLANIIAKSFPGLTWSMGFVSCMIFVSLTVSFVSVGISTKHMLDGLADSLAGHHGSPALARRVSYLLVFGLVGAISLLRPTSFLTIIGVAGSVTLNIESGIFILWLHNKSQKLLPAKGGGEEGPLPAIPHQAMSPRASKATATAVCLYLTGAALYAAMKAAI
jgi:amino acid permease